MSHHQQASFYLLLYICIFSNICSEISACQLGTEVECKGAPFVPGHNLAGEGFDVVSLRRKSAYLINVKSYLFQNNTCILCENRLQKGQLQKLPLAFVDWRTTSKCSSISSAFYNSVNSLIKRSSLISNSWMVDLSLEKFGSAVLEGSSSDIAKFAQLQHIKERMTFGFHEISCIYYKYRVKNRPELSAEFTNHLLQLPRNYNEETKSKYLSIINTYGTHYIDRVNLGGHVRQVTALRTCLATLKGYSESEIKNCLNIELQVALGFLPASILFSNKCFSILKDNMEMGSNLGFLTRKMDIFGGKSYIPVFEYYQNPSEAYTSWRNSLHDYPEIMSYDIISLHQLVDDPELRANLKTAVSEYIKENMLPANNLVCNPTTNLDHNCCPVQAGHGTLEVVVQRATGFNGDFFSQTDCYVKILYNNMHKQTDMVRDNDNPEWNTSHTFDSIEFGHRLILEIWDSDVRFDDLLGTCVTYPKPGSYLCTCRFGKGVFYFTYTAQCHAHLTGTRCENYSPTS